MTPAQPLLVVRLNTRSTAWRLPRTADPFLEMVNVPVARAPGQPGIPFSFAALPGRYLAELLTTAARWHRGQTVVLLNPAHQVPSDCLALVQAELAERADVAHTTQGCPAVRLLVDYNDHILAYCVPARHVITLAADKAVRDLSTTDAELDQTLLDALNIPCTVQRVRTPPGFSLEPALPYFPGMSGMARHVARARVRNLKTGTRTTWGVLTHHAGDILLALKVLERTPGIDGLVIHKAYADIARDVLPDLPCITVDGPLPARGMAASASHALNDDILYFEQVVMPVLPPDAGLLYMRPVRGYIDADFTLAAQLAFLIGETADTAAFPTGTSLYLAPENPLYTLENPLHNPENPTGNTTTAENPAETQGAVKATETPPGLPDHLPINLPAVRGKRVLLHFDGGWPLKVYPPEHQQALIEHLLDLGCQVSVLGAFANAQANVPTHAFTTLSALRALILEHDALIGMDSFPCHYASQQLGVPTVCLYASTRQINLAHAAPCYLAVSCGLDCSPCGSRLTCPRFGGTRCHNFIDPKTVANLFARCLVTP